MPVFEYEAVDTAGKRFREKIEAQSLGDVIRRLRGLGLVVIDVREVSGGAEKKEKGKRTFKLSLDINITSGVSYKDLSIVARQLAALVEAGIGIVDALELVADAIDNKVLKKVLPQIAEEVRSGTSFAKALTKYKRIFGEFFINMAEIGEETGQLEAVMKKVSEYYETISEIVNKIKSASFYPIFVIIIATLITGGILYFVVPTFAEIYKSLGGELPAPTQMLIKVSDWLRTHILWILGGIVAFFITFMLLYRYVYIFRKAVDWLKLKLPLLGPLFMKGALANLSRTFATLFAAGVSIERALELSARVAGNVIYQEAIEKIKHDVIRGEPIWRAFEKTKWFPKMFIAMIKIGEETGQLDNMLESLARFYEDEVKTTIEGLISMIEPMMIVVIGSIVGTILIALYMPIFKLGELIK
jgi:type IV pilus assembly protein PilC